MKKTDFHSTQRNLLTENSKNYYKEIGKTAATYTFTKSALKHNFNSLSPAAKLFIQKNELALQAKKNASKQSSRNTAKIRKNLSPTLEEIPKILLSESAKNLPSSVRDVSHIKDLALSRAASREALNLKFFELPTDLARVKKALELKDSFGICLSDAGKSFKLLGPDQRLEKSDSAEIDKILLGNPSSRQECENLAKWIEKMKELYCENDEGESLNLIYLMAAKEVTRQVSVHCFERGELLIEIFQYFFGCLNAANHSVQMLEKSVKRVKRAAVEEFEIKEKGFQDKIKELEDLIDVLNERLADKMKIISEMNLKAQEESKVIEELKIKIENEIENNYRGVIFKNAKGVKQAINSFSVNRGKNEKNIYSSEKEAQTDHKEKYPFFSSETQTFHNLELFRCGLGIEVFSAAKGTSENFQNYLGLPEEPVVSINYPASKTNKARKSSISSAKAYNQRSKKNSQSPLIELARRLKEKDKRIAMLESLLESQKKFEENTEGPKITVSQVGDFSDFNLLSFQTGYKSGFDNGYSAGFKHILDDSLLSQKSQDANESAEKVEEEDSFDKEIQKERELISLNSINREKDISENDSNLSSSEEENLKKKEKKYKRSLLFNSSLVSSNLKSNVLSVAHIVQFNYVKKVYKDNKRQLAVKILDKIMDKKMGWFKKRAFMTKKMVNKMIFLFYNSYYLKGDFQEPFVFFVYEELLQRSALKTVGDRKFVQFISSMIVMHPLRRPTNFIKFLGAGNLVNSHNFLPFSLKFYLDCMSFMNNSKIGISVIDETQDKVMLPLSRAIECIKEKMEKFDKGSIGKVISFIESKVEPDTKKINKVGMIDCELFLEVLVSSFEEFQEKVFDGVEHLMNALKFEEDKSLFYMSECLLIIRIFCNDCTEKFEETFKGEEVALEDFCQFCIENSVLSINEIKKHVPFPPMSSTELFPIIHTSVSETLELLKTLKNTEKLLKYWKYENIKNKLTSLQNSLQKREVYECLLAAEIFKLELNRIKSI